MDLMMHAHDFHTNESESSNSVIYESFPFNISHPAHLYSMAHLFGLNPPPIEKARVLELGCSNAGNLIPLAVTYPDSHFVGIDLSEPAIELGNKTIQALDLKNIELKTQSILDFSKDEGLFDYIICHGVFSWVDKKIQDKIFRICKENLKPNGVSYISYNTMPGWNMVHIIRDLMLWHTKTISDPKQKVAQARNILKFVTDGTSEDLSPYMQFLKNEINLISSAPDYYILHEHLSQHNDPIYFFQFMDQANQHKLSYISDATLSTMYTGNLPKPFPEELNKIKNIVSVNQYMDFIRNTRFRSTLLCHDSKKINRNIDVKDVTQWYLQLHAKLEESDFTEEMISSDKVIRISYNGVTQSSLTPNHKAVLYVLFKNRFKLIHYDELKSEVKQYCSLNDEELDHLLLHDVNIMRMALSGLLQFSYHPNRFTTAISETPKACPLVQYQATFQNFVFTRKHQVWQLDPIAKFILPNLDGTHTHHELIEMLSKKINQGDISILDQNKKPIEDREEKNKIVTDIYFQVLNKCAESGVLVS